MKYACTECETIYTSFTKASVCHWGIGGVIEVKNGETFDQALTREWTK